MEWLIILIISAIGFVVGWWVRGKELSAHRTIKRQARELNLLRQRNDELRAENDEHFRQQAGGRVAESIIKGEAE